MPLLNVFCQPTIRNGAVVNSFNIRIDPCPCGATIVIAGTYDVEHIWKGIPDPDAAVILVGDGVDPEFCNQFCGFFFTLCLINFIQCMRQGIYTSPGR